MTGETSVSASIPDPYGRLVTSFVVETFVPAGSRERFAGDVDGLRRATSEAAGDRVRHIRSYLVPGDEMGFHLVEAGTAADVDRIARRAGIEPERIVEAVGIDGSADPIGARPGHHERKGAP